MNELAQGTCLSCLGGGEVSSERGLSFCADCQGTGKIGSELQRTERRLREIELRTQNLTGEISLDIRWLIGNIRRYRTGLLKVMSAAQDGGSPGNEASAEKLLKAIQFDANEVLEIYPKESDL